jgi:hypothetical protein
MEAIGTHRMCESAEMAGILDSEQFGRAGTNAMSAGSVAQGCAGLTQ